ncbi:MAG: metallophosphoesterase family protein [Bacteroidota bacterium]
MRKIAISDIHGCEKTFRELIKKIKLEKEDELFILGDFIDRGPDSRGVINYVFSLREKGFSVHTLMGNHEAMLMNSFSDSMQHRMWLSNGGNITMKSFRVDHIADIPEKYLNFFYDCYKYIESDEFIFVHAGIDFRDEDPISNENALMWVRRWYDNIDYEWLGNRYIIHGHTPVGRNTIREMLDQFDVNRYLNIDNGCFRVHESKDKGALCAIDLTNRKLYFQNNVDPMEDWQ